MQWYPGHQSQAHCVGHPPAVSRHSPHATTSYNNSCDIETTGLSGSDLSASAQGRCPSILWRRNHWLPHCRSMKPGEKHHQSAEQHSHTSRREETHNAHMSSLAHARRQIHAHLAPPPRTNAPSRPEHLYALLRQPTCQIGSHPGRTRGHAHQRAMPPPARPHQ